MVIMGVDLGDVRTGLSICDKMEFLASPLKVITQKDREKLCEEISLLAKENKVELIVVGNPKNMDGSSGYRSEECSETALLIQQKTGIDVEMFDERSTTMLAHSYLNETNTRGKKRKQTVDAVAATIILENFLAYRKNMKE